MPCFSLSVEDGWFITQALPLVQGCLFFVVIFSGAVTDILHGRVYNLCCGVGLGCGLLLSLIRGGLTGAPVSLASSLTAAAIAFAVFFAFYLIGGLGAGDVKLVTAVGAIAASWKFMLWVIVNTAFAGVPLAIGVLLWRKDLKSGLRRSVRGMFRWKYQRPEPENNDQAETQEKPAMHHVPYAVAICLGALMTVWLHLNRGMQLPFM